MQCRHPAITSGRFALIRRSGLNGLPQRRAALVCRAEARQAIPERIPLTIEIKKEVAFGEAFKVVGSDDRLGNWNVQLGCDLVWSEGHIWKGTAHVSTNSPVKFKLVRVGKNSINWESGENRNVLLSQPSKAVCNWNDTSNTTVLAADRDAAVSAAQTTVAQLADPTPEAATLLAAELEAALQQLAEERFLAAAATELVSLEAAASRTSLKALEAQLADADRNREEAAQKLQNSQDIVASLEFRLSELSSALDRQMNATATEAQLASEQMASFEIEREGFSKMFTAAVQREGELGQSLVVSQARVSELEQQVSHLQSELSLAQADLRRVAGLEKDLAAAHERSRSLELKLTQIQQQKASIVNSIVPFDASSVAFDEASRELSSGIPSAPPATAEVPAVEQSAAFPVTARNPEPEVAPASFARLASKPSVASTFNGIASLLGDVLVKSTKAASSPRSRSASPPKTTAARSSASLSPVASRKRLAGSTKATEEAVAEIPQPVSAPEPPASPTRKARGAPKTIVSTAADSCDGAIAPSPAARPKSPRKARAPPPDSDTA